MMEFVPRLAEINPDDLPDVLQALLAYCKEHLQEEAASIEYDTKTSTYYLEFTSFTLDIKVNTATKVIDIRNVKSSGGKDRATDAILNLVYIAKDLGYLQMYATDVQDGAMSYWVETLNFTQVDDVTAMRDIQKAELFEW
jgi:hypothetical protein